MNGLYNVCFVEDLIILFTQIIQGYIIVWGEKRILCEPSRPRSSPVPPISTHIRPYITTLSVCSIYSLMCEKRNSINECVFSLLSAFLTPLI